MLVVMSSKMSLTKSFKQWWKMERVITGNYDCIENLRKGCGFSTEPTTLCIYLSVRSCCMFLLMYFH